MPAFKLQSIQSIRRKAGQQLQKTANQPYNKGRASYKLRLAAFNTVTQLDSLARMPPGTIARVMGSGPRPRMRWCLTFCSLDLAASSASAARRPALGEKCFRHARSVPKPCERSAQGVVPRLF